MQTTKAVTRLSNLEDHFGKPIRWMCSLCGDDGLVGFSSSRRRWSITFRLQFLLHVSYHLDDISAPPYPVVAVVVTFLKDTTSDLVQKNIVTGLECLLILQELRPFYHEQISLQLKALLSKKNDTNVSSQPGETSVDPSKLLTELDCLEVQLAASLSLAEPDPSTFSSLQETRAFLDRVDFVCFRFACARTISTHQDQEAVSAMYPDRGSREVFMVAKLCFSGAKFLANLGYMEEAYNYVIRVASSRFDGHLFMHHAL